MGLNSDGGSFGEGIALAQVRSYGHFRVSGRIFWRNPLYGRFLQARDGGTGSNSWLACPCARPRFVRRIGAVSVAGAAYVSAVADINPFRNVAGRPGHGTGYTHHTRYTDGIQPAWGSLLGRNGPPVRGAGDPGRWRERQCSAEQDHAGEGPFSSHVNGAARRRFLYDC